jgi:hypothetical protein
VSTARRQPGHNDRDSLARELVRPVQWERAMGLFTPTESTDDKGVTRVKPGDAQQASYDAIDTMFFNPLEAITSDMFRGKTNTVYENDAAGKPVFDKNGHQATRDYDFAKDGGGYLNPLNAIGAAGHAARDLFKGLF